MKNNKYNLLVVVLLILTINSFCVNRIPIDYQIQVNNLTSYTLTNIEVTIEDEVYNITNLLPGNNEIFTIAYQNQFRFAPPSLVIHIIGYSNASTTITDSPLNYFFDVNNDLSQEKTNIFEVTENPDTTSHNTFQVNLIP